MRVWYWATAAVAATFGVIVLPQLLGASADTVGTLSDLGQLGAAALASVGCAVAVRRGVGHRRSAWRWLSIATGAWAAGEAVWTFYEVVLGRDVPFPSLADVGFLVFPLAAGWGLVQWLGATDDQRIARGRDVLDGAVIAGSLLALSWVTALGSVVAAGSGDGWFAFTLSLGYPVGDVIVVTLGLLALARGRRLDRRPLLLLTLGLGGVSLADSAFVYLTSTSTYTSADMLCGAGWTLGFLVVGIAGVTATADTGRRRLVLAASRWQLGLPYVPLSAAMAAVVWSLFGLKDAPTATLVIGGVLIMIVLLRQFLAVLDNQRLVAALGEARDALQHQALHDALTGLPNRVLFGDRLDHALTRHDAAVCVMFCDLDDFKHVNDRLGHEAGDQLLREIAARLQACVRDTDTVARLGGDEFAVLLEDTVDAEQVAQRIVDSMAPGADLAGRRVATAVSVGIAYQHALCDEVPEAERRREGSGMSNEERAALAAVLLREADMAMYAAKSRGKNQVAHAGDEISLAG